ncbi:hypothetical protein NHU_04327 [Rhodovulum sulfidophilum]|uniref:DUF4123 domain-containing protein n=1 Tax=Rhodovulum sulfidophilum TaxID=35806 RepID=A0A0D6B9D7_RHOSU|nr:hypothetical protein NHU_04327 [Rhodovulum sulfidophilum]
MIQTIFFNPLDAQFGVFPRQSLPALIAAKLAQSGNGALFALIDAARFGDAEALVDAGGQCLFELDEENSLGDVAPYLLALDDAPDLLRGLFTRSAQANALWGKEVGVLLRSQSGIAQLRRHLRRFTQIPGEDGKPRFLRFYDPVVMRHILTALSADEARIARWFWHGDNRIVESWIVPQERIDGVLFAQMPDRLPRPIPPFRIDASYQAIFDAIMTERLARKVSGAVRLSVGNPCGLAAEAWERLMLDATALSLACGCVTPRAIGYIASVAVLRNTLPSAREIADWVPAAGHPAQEGQQAKAFYQAQQDHFERWPQARPALLTPEI